MMIANLPVVLLGHCNADRLLVRMIHWLAMALFTALGISALACA